MEPDEELDAHPGVQREVARLVYRERAQAIFAERSRDERASLNLQRGGSIREQESPPQLVSGVLPEGSLFQIFGETGSFKSFMVLDLALSIANGLPWMGHEVEAPGAVALVLGEGGADAGARLNSWLTAHPGSSADLVAFSVEQQLDLMLSGDVDAIIDDLATAREADHPDVPWRMVVFDTQADHMPSGDEDRAKDFTVVKRSIQRIAQATGAAVGLVHHTGWDKSRERGSSRQRQALDVVMKVDGKTVTNIKQKSGRLFDSIKFETVEVGESLIVRKRTVDEAMSDAAESMSRDLGDAKPIVIGILSDPTLTAKRIKVLFSMGHARWATLSRLLEDLGYIEVVKGSPGRADSITVTDAGREWAEA